MNLFARIQKVNNPLLFTIINGIMVLSLPIIAYSLLLSWKIPRQIGLAFRYGFTTTVIPMALILFLGYMLPGWWGRAIALGLTLICFALPLSGLWASGESEQYLLGGLLPYSDAGVYYLASMKLLEGARFASLASRRPLFSGMMAVLLGLTDYNLQITLAILTAITAISCYLAARQVQKNFGTATGVFVIIVLFLFYRPIIGKTLTENLGLTLGVIGFTLLWQGAEQRHRIYALLGIFMTSLALNARAGAFFVLPALVLWGAWYFRSRSYPSLSFLVWGCCAVVLGFLFNWFIFKTLASSGMLFSNFSQTIYGVAVGGKSWAQIFTDHPEIGAFPEPQQSIEVYKLALEAIITNPGRFLEGCLKSWRDFFSIGGYNSICFISGYNDIGVMGKIARVCMYILGILGVISWYQKREDGFHSLIMAATLGILLSVPLAPPLDSNRMRVYAATIPFYIALPALGLTYIIKKIKLKFLYRTPENITSKNSTIIFGVILVLFSTLGPVVVKSVSQPTQHSAITCQNGEDPVYMRISNGSYITVVDDDELEKDWLPNIFILRYTRAVHNFPNFEMHSALESIKPNTTLVRGINLEKGHELLLLANHDTIPDDLGVVGVCGEMKTVFFYNFLYAETIENVSIPEARLIE